MADTFRLDIAKFAAKAGANAELVVRKISIDLFTKTIKRTPVDTGRARANWNTSVNAPDVGVTQTTDTSGVAAIGEVKARIGNWKQGDIYLTNSLPYIRRLEYDGWSKQAPAGMVRVTVTEFQTFVDNAVRSLPK